MATGSDIAPKEYRRHRDALEAFRDAYGRYLDTSLRGAPSELGEAELRSEVARLIPKAQEALAAAGQNLTIYAPPDVGPHPPYSGLANVAFLHERRGWRSRGVTRSVRDGVEIGIAELERREENARRQRRRPLYWPDRLVRAVLGLPPYLLSLVLGVPVSRVEQAPWGPLLRALELILATLGVFFGGRQAGWW